MKSSILWLVALVLTLCGTCMATASEKSKALEVTLLVFSGRPNPVLTLTDPAEIKEILALAHGLPRAGKQLSDEAAIPARLGYQGIAVRNRSDVSPELAGFLVHRGNVQLKWKSPAAAKSDGDDALLVGSESESRDDRTAKLERRLLMLARERGVIDQRVLQMIERGK